jgi:hypothetical protein
MVKTEIISVVFLSGWNRISRMVVQEGQGKSSKEIKTTPLAGKDG